MNFFERQHAARGTTVRLVLLFTLAVLTIVVAIDLVVLFLVRGNTASGIAGALIAATVVTLLLIGGGTLTKMIALRAGGAAVAQSVGAVPIDATTSDPVLRRFVNVVEEMSIASGVPVPRLFVLEQEEGINAFAAGYTPSDAAITATAGALRQLNRDELQGVIGHEFSHVLNGDMRLNVRLIGLLNGILLLGLVGLRVLAFGGGGGGRDSKRDGNPVLVIALALLVLGFIGQFFAALIKAAVSRQREWLADASAVQFTRQSAGLVGALKKIAGLPAGSALQDRHGERQVSHMLFGEGTRSVSRFWATHPPLLERIAVLEPGFDAVQAAQLGQSYAADGPDGMAEDAALGLVGTSAPAPVDAVVRVEPRDTGNRVATFSPDDLERGRVISDSIAPQFRQLAGQPSTAVPLVLALLLDQDRRVREQQLQIITSRMGRADAVAAAGFVDLVAGLPPIHRLPVASLAVPVVVARPPGRLDALVGTLDAMAAADGMITLFEYCLTRLVAGYVRDSLEPAKRSRPGRVAMTQVPDATLTLLAVVAATGNGDPSVAEHAFTASVQHLMPGRSVDYAPPPDCAAALDGGWEALDSLDPRAKQQLVEALVLAVRDDGVVTVAEAELLRATCGLLHCPLPALLT
ncbi:MAG: M48 family metalloprotease [Actinomycetota bacterium]|nr:M48 family metalloprotease [Actinomycetota bacterium]